MGAAWVRGAVGVVALLLATAGCGSDEDVEGDVPSVSGVLLDGPDGAPVESAEVELLVLPSAMGSSAEAVQPVSADRASTGSDGTYRLEAAVDDLTLNAGADGRVQVEVRPVGEKVGTRTTVLLRRDRKTGEAQVVETTGVVVESQAG